MNETIELVTFRLASGDAQSFVAANGMINDWLRKQPGFISRRLGQKSDGSWVDVLLWSSDEAAKTAGGKAMTELGDCPAMAMIAPSEDMMAHASVALALG